MELRLKPSSPEMTANDQAAAWFARQRTGPLSDADAIEFSAWLKADPTYTAAWKEYERLWSRLESVRDDPRVLALREAARHRAQRRRALQHGWRISAALAATVLVGVGVWWGLQGAAHPSGRPQVLAQSPSGDAAGPALIRSASTEIGERSFLILPDGSKVTLNTASAVIADYSGHERRVTLVRGEAFFDVAKDPTRPFVVAAGPRQVIAVGTVFDVRLQDRQMRVTLVEGKVRVLAARAPVVALDAQAAPGSGVILEAGSALVTGEDEADHIERLDTARVTSWRSGKLVFDGERLADVVADMNRYSREKLQIADADLNDRKVSGVFEATGGPAFAKALEAYGIARVAKQSATAIVLDAP